MFMQMPDVNILYVCDTDPNAPGISLAREHGIKCCHDPDFPELARNPGIDLILEITGSREVFQKLNEIKHPETSLIGAEGNRFIFELLGTQEEAKKELKTYQETLEKRIVERTRDLKKTNEQLQEINNQKTRYLLRSTHQLKAPFAAIESFTDVILGGFAGDVSDKVRDVIQKIKQRCVMLSVSIREMLELANLKSVVVENIKKDNHYLSSIIREVLQKQKVLAEKKHISIEFSPEKTKRDAIFCNRHQIAILLSILVENAIYYSHEGSTIEIGVSEKDSRVTASVRDHGIGISEQNIERMFEEYFRSNRAAAKHPNGTGLGLAIGKHIADLNEIDIKVTSKVDNGTTVTITMPRVT